MKVLMVGGCAHGQVWEITYDQWHRDSPLNIPEPQHVTWQPDDGDVPAELTMTVHSYKATPIADPFTRRPRPGYLCAIEPSTTIPIPTDAADAVVLATADRLWYAWTRLPLPERHIELIKATFEQAKVQFAATLHDAITASTVPGHGQIAAGLQEELITRYREALELGIAGQEEIRRLKVQLAERHADYAKTLKELAASLLIKANEEAADFHKGATGQ